MEEVASEEEPAVDRLPKQDAYIKDEVQLMRRLGGGQFGDVYLGVWNGREVALKKLKDNSPNAEREFKREAERMKFLKDCPNVVRYVRLWRDPDNGLYLVMEYWSDGSLSQAIANVPEAARLRWIIDALSSTADGLAQLHAHGIVHRDVAARNVLVRRQEDTIVCGLADLGLAGFSTDYVTDSEKPWRTSAPESFDPTVAKLTPAADIWSFGLLIWELLTDSKPFPNLKSIPLNFVHGQYHEHILECHPRPDACPDGLWDLLEDCLQVRISNRPSIEDVQRQLAELQLSTAVPLDSVDYA